MTPYDRGTAGAGSLSLLDEGVRWLAVAPLTLAATTVLAAFLLRRREGSGALLGLGAGLCTVFLPLLYPAFASSGDGDMSFGAGGIVGLVGAAFVTLGGVLALTRPTTVDHVLEPEPESPTGGTAS